LPEKHADVHGSIIRELDKYENECMPDVSVSRLQIDFGEVKYERPVTETIVIENVGQVSIYYFIAMYIMNLILNLYKL
jgi:phosphatidylinositol-bisphosphatase